jgi:hypothetical protein
VSAKAKRQADFDPTPGEEEAAERARPKKLPRCMKCKAAVVTPCPSNLITNLRLRLTTVLSTERATLFTLRDVEHHRTLAMCIDRLERNWYCKACTAHVAAYVEGELK